MATTRLRKAFRYPDDEDSDMEDMDEEHQERLIATLQVEDARRTQLYRRAFLAVPVTGALYFVYAFAVNSQTARQRLVALLSLSSLLASAYILQYMPLQAADAPNTLQRFRADAARGPVERYIVRLNAALAAVLALAALTSWTKGAYEQAWRDALALIIFGMTMFARHQLAPLDLADLHNAKFDLKGA